MLFFAFEDNNGLIETNYKISQFPSLAVLNQKTNYTSVEKRLAAFACTRKCKARATTKKHKTDTKEGNETSDKSKRTHIAKLSWSMTM